MSEHPVSVGGVTADQIRIIVREEIQSALEPVKGDVASLKGDVASLKSQNEIIINGISNLAVRLTRLEERRTTDEVPT